jgi:hypothetical protein
MSAPSAGPPSAGPPSGSLPFLRLHRLAAAGALLLLAAAALGWSVAREAFFHAWLAGFVLWTGIGTGCLGLLMLGHLLGESWLGPVRAELEAGALTLLPMAVAAVPVLLGLDAVYPWASPGYRPGFVPAIRAGWLAPPFFALRMLACLAVWGLLAWGVTRPGRYHRRVSAAGLVLFVPTVTLAATDWVMSMHPQWLSSAFGPAFAATQLAAALALAVLAATIRPDREPPGRVASLAGGLLVLIAAAAYLWFMQFLVVWSADLPGEVAWYLERSGGWRWLLVGLILPAVALSALLLLHRRSRQRRPVLIVASCLLLVQHVAHHYWQIRPSAEGSGIHWTDPVAVAALGLVWLAAFVRALPGRPAPARAQG